MSKQDTKVDSKKSSRLNNFLNRVEAAGNKCPDPSILFIFATLLVWVLSAILSRVTFDLVAPNGDPVVVTNLMTLPAMTNFLATMVTGFTSFPPLGIVLVAMLGVGVAENSGMISSMLKQFLRATPKKLLTPLVIFIAMVSHVAADAGYILVIPLAGVMFLAAGRHPILGIATAFVGVSGGFAANIIPCANDAILQSFTQSAAEIIEPGYTVNILSNYFFSMGSTLLIVLVGWWITEKIIAPRLDDVAYEATETEFSEMETSPLEKRALNISYLIMLLGLILLAFLSYPSDSPFRDASNGQLTTYSAPLMQSIVPIIFFIFLIPGIAYGFITKSFTSTKDVTTSMAKTFTSMSGFMVMVFFCSIFLGAFNASKLGLLLGISGAELLKQLALPGAVTIVIMMIILASINLIIGSASAKWAMLSPIVVPMLMGVGISPELTQAAFRVGDSVTNIITPLMVYFPLIVVYCQKYVKNYGIGSVISLMLPYSMGMFVAWTILLLVWWFSGIPLGFDAPFDYIPK